TDVGVEDVYDFWHVAMMGSKIGRLESRFNGATRCSACKTSIWSTSRAHQKRAIYHGKSRRVMQVPR
ncbi:MAG: hypothetical protein ACK5UX_01585, partial [Burkholderiales bacterium]